MATPRPIRMLAAGALTALLLAGCGGSKPRLPRAPATIAVSSPAVRPGGMLPVRFTCDGAGTALPLRWGAIPPQAREVAVVVTDPDAPGGPFVHWTVYGLPPTLHAIAGGEAPPGAKQGVNGFGKQGWGPPCPPAGPPHRYEAAVYWLRHGSGLKDKASADQVLAAILAKAGGRGVMSFLYARKGS
ncbi:MAG TPA: YbhB/YbcL family Raf kinase inhibitor-like protein [Solirubrobacteraceae bacterium]|nr:YbhB/YbcL family Raf kinase inhibitor-like protein [Solirubrobacteraceae bacterium]